MGLLFYLLIVGLIITGLVSLQKLYSGKNSQLDSLIDGLKPAIGWIGLGLLVISVIELVGDLRAIGLLLRIVPLTTIVTLLALVAGVLLGFVYFSDLLKKFGVLNADKTAGLDSFLEKLMIPLGFVAVISAVYLLLWSIFKWGA